MNLLSFSSFTFDINSLELTLDQSGCAPTASNSKSARAANQCKLSHKSLQPELTLRPKTAELLRVLITQRATVLTKRELINAVWHSDHVADQNLFQAISELRRTLAPLQPIKTLPNRGYQWVEPVIECNGQTSSSKRQGSWHHMRGAMAAGFVGLLLGGIVLGGFDISTYDKQLNNYDARSFKARSQPNADDNTTYSSERGNTRKPLIDGAIVGKNVQRGQPISGQVSRSANAKALKAQPGTPPSQLEIPPALTAFVNGITQLNNGDNEAALKLFELSASENPRFAEAKLMLAESSLRLGQALHAREQGLAIIQQQINPVDAYTLISAMDLVSRSEQQLGQNNAAMSWAFEAATQAAEEGFVCTAIDLRERLDVLRTTSDLGSAIRHFEPSVVLLEPSFEDALTTELEVTKGDQQTRHCALLRSPSPEASHLIRPDAMPRLAILVRSKREFEV